LAVRKPWARDPISAVSSYDPIPLFEGLRPILAIPERDRWHQWLGVPGDIDRRDRIEPMYVRLPDNWTAEDTRHNHVAQIVQHYLPGEWTPVWYLEGYVEFHPLPEQLPVLPQQGAVPEAPGSADAAVSTTPESVALPSYQPPEIDPEFSPSTPIVIDGGEIERARRDYR
ncbi:MAG: hypothetical protein ACRDTD_20335, partial [Pseudonocardiaceae bacterium]